jgi:DNA-binding MarR family transcriptional regulator
MSTAIAPGRATSAAVAPAHGAPISATTVQQLRSEIRSLLRRARAVLRTAEPAVDLGLRQPALDVLGSVVTRPRTSPAQIAEHLRVDEATTTRHVTELEQLGLIVRVTDLRHPAYKVLMPTSMGQRVHGHGADTADDVLQATLAGWTAGEVETLIRLLAKLNQSQPV